MPFMAGYDAPNPKEHNMIPSLIRTYTPLLVAYLVGWLASLGISVSDEAQAAIVTAIGTVAAALYYAIVRVLERRWPALSVLLGSSQQPATYTPGGPATTGTGTLDPDREPDPDADPDPAA